MFNRSAAHEIPDSPVLADLLLQIAKLTRELYGHHSERSLRLLDQMELQLEELEANAASVVSFNRRKPARQPFPEHLPRERV